MLQKEEKTMFCDCGRKEITVLYNGVMHEQGATIQYPLRQDLPVIPWEYHSKKECYTMDIRKLMKHG